MIYMSKVRLKYINILSRMLVLNILQRVSRPLTRSTTALVRLLPISSTNLIKRDLTIKGIANYDQSNICKTTSHSIQITRNYAKGKDRKKEKGKSKVEVNESQLSEVLNVASMKSQMQKIIEQLKDDFVKNLSLRSTTGSIETLVVNFEEKEHTLQELAQIGRKNPTTIVINMAIFPQAIPAALKAISKSGMNLNPQQDGTTIYIPIPKVTKEHRETLAKNAKQLLTKCRDGIRDVQIKQVKQLKRKENISQDLARNIEAQIIAIADGFISEGEKIYETKKEELIGKD